MTRKVVVTGGGGFIGAALCRRLLRAGYEVQSLARGDYPQLAQEGVKVHRVDLSSPAEKWQEHLNQAYAVLHLAAKAEPWGRYRDFYQANVLATRQVIAACKAMEVPRLVFTSSPSILVDGRPLRGVDESYPVPAGQLCHYGTTKALAEAEALAANSDTLATISLRPHMVYGSAENTVTSRMVRMAREGKLVRIGGPEALTDVCYIDDAVEAHVLALEKLEPGSAVAGQAYFISEGRPIPFYWFAEQVVRRNGLPFKAKTISPAIAGMLARCCEAAFAPLPAGFTPPLTRYLLFMASCDHYFSIEKARRDLGFVPQFETDRGLAAAFPGV